MASAIILAAGSGARFGGAKQFEMLGPARLVDHVVATAASVAQAVVLVLPPGVTWDGAPVHAVVPGGPTRSASVRAGLGALPPATEVVVIHDAAHPLAARGLFEAGVEPVQGALRASETGADCDNTEGHAWLALECGRRSGPLASRFGPARPGSGASGATADAAAADHPRTAADPRRSGTGASGGTSARGSPHANP